MRHRNCINRQHEVQSLQAGLAMATTTESWLAAEIVDDVESKNAKRLAHRIAGIVANDERISAAIQAAIDKEANAHGILAAVATALTK
jgi:hypothetical protein